MSETILITGATGNVGKELVALLANSYHNIRAAVRDKKAASALKGQNIETVEFDFSRPATITSAFKRVDRAFLLVPFVPELVGMNQQMVDAAIHARVKHIVRMSANGADPNNPTPGKWHGEADNALIKSKIPFTILRPNFFMQNFINFNASTIKSQGDFYQPSGDGKVAYIDSRDISATAAAVLTRPGHDGQIYNLTGPEAITNHQAAEIISQAVGRKINYVDIPEEDARKQMKKSGMTEWMVEAMMNLMAVQKNGYASTVSPAVEQITGTKPRTFEDFARDYAWAWK